MGEFVEKVLSGDDFWRSVYWTRADAQDHFYWDAGEFTGTARDGAFLNNLADFFLNRCPKWAKTIPSTANSAKTGNLIFPKFEIVLPKLEMNPTAMVRSAF
jgi:hypothetical protein